MYAFLILYYVFNKIDGVHVLSLFIPDTIETDSCYQNTMVMCYIYIIYIATDPLPVFTSDVRPITHVISTF